MITTEQEAQAQIAGNGNICQVIGCNRPRGKEHMEVYLELSSGDEYLFSAWFCDFHNNIFGKNPMSLMLHLQAGKIRGIDPNIVKR